MSKTFQNVKGDRECNEKCYFNGHINAAISAITKKEVLDQELASYLSNLCCNIGKIRDDLGVSALHMASSCGRCKLARWLVIAKKSDINLRDLESGYTPLQRSVFYGHIDIAVQLIKLGADQNLFDHEDLNAIGLVTYDRSPLVEISLHVPCQVYVWGTNCNNTIGSRTGTTRKSPELLAHFKRNFVSIIQVVMDELHSLFLSSCGQVWTCGHGLGGRLGTGNENHALLPVPLRINNEQCIKAEIALNHTLLLLQSGTVLSCGLNSHHQLGIVPYVESCLLPKPVHSSSFKSGIQGICAGKYHSVFYTKKALYTCGLNAGQLGHPPSLQSPFISAPSHVPLILRDTVITQVGTSCGAIVVVTDKGDIYALHQFQCKKIASKLLDIVAVSVFGGKLESKLLSETGDDLKIALLTSRGTVLFWDQSFPQITRCIFEMKRHITVTHIFLSHRYLLFTTDKGEAYQGTVGKMKNKVTGAKPVDVKSTFHSFVERSECYLIHSKKLPNIHRAVGITSDPKSNNFAVIQTNPCAGMTEVPVKSKSNMSNELIKLLEEASDEDSLHDVVFNISGEKIPAHRYILSLEKSLISEMVQSGGEVVIKDFKSYIFKQLLSYLYSGNCDVLILGGFKESVLASKEDPVKMLLEVSCKFKVTSLTKKLQCLRYQNGCISLKEGREMPEIHPPIMNRRMFPEYWDIKLRSTDGVEIDAHKCILASRVLYFHSMFVGGWAETGMTGRLSLPFPGTVLNDVVDFIYSEDAIDLESVDDTDHIVSLLIVADQLLISHLKETCEVALCNSLTLKNAATILQLAKTYNAEQLRLTAMDFIHLNLDTILESRTLECLSDSLLSEFSSYHREKMMWRYGKRVITPFSNAPPDEEIRGAPPVYWPDNLNDFQIEENDDEVKKSKASQSTTKKKVSKKRVFTPSEDQEISIQKDSLEQSSDIATTPPSRRTNFLQQDILLTPPSSLEKDKPLYESCSGTEGFEVQFPSLDHSFQRKKAVSNLSSKTKTITPPKLSQKQRKKLFDEVEFKVESPPKSQFKGWAVEPLPSDCIVENNGNSTPPSKKKFADIIATDKEERDNWAKMKDKPFSLTQLEDKAMEELLIFYNANEIYDERISVRRVLPINIAKPIWVKSNKRI